MEINELEKIVLEINTDLYYYDRDGHSFLKRSPTGELENVACLESFLEARLNLELFYVPGLFDLVKYFDGHLIKVTRLEGKDELHRRYTKGYAEVVYPGDEYFLGDPDNPGLDPKSVFDNITEALGYRSFSFSGDTKQGKVWIGQ